MPQSARWKPTDALRSRQARRHVEHNHSNVSEGLRPANPEPVEVLEDPS